jgi:hypothetical protein
LRDADLLKSAKVQTRWAAKKVAKADTAAKFLPPSKTAPSAKPPNFEVFAVMLYAGASGFE